MPTASAGTWTGTWVGLPNGVTFSGASDGSLPGVWNYAMGSKMGVYQKLSSRNGNEVIDQGSY